MKRMVVELDPTDENHTIEHELGNDYVVSAYAENGDTLFPSVVKHGRTVTVAGKGMCTTTAQDRYVRRVVIMG